MRYSGSKLRWAILFALASGLLGPWARASLSAETGPPVVGNIALEDGGNEGNGFLGEWIPAILIVGEGGDFLYPRALAERHADRNILVATFRGGADEPNLAGLQDDAANLRGWAAPFDVRNQEHWNAIGDAHHRDFERIIFNNPHAGYGMHKLLSQNIRTNRDPRISAEEYNNVLPDNVILAADGETAPKGEVFEHVVEGDTYRALQEVEGLNNNIYRTYAQHGVGLLNADGRIVINCSGQLRRFVRLFLPSNGGRFVTGRGSIQGDLISSAPYDTALTVELEDCHESWGFTEENRPRSANLRNMYNCYKSPE